MAVEIEEEDVVAVPVAELRGGGKPTVVAHQPAVHHHHAGAFAVRGRMRRRHVLAGQEQPKPREICR